MKKTLSTKKIKVSQPSKLKVAIVQSTYHNELNSNMTAYCIKALTDNGLKKENISVFHAPGTWEVPLITKKALASGEFNAIVTFGIIIKGETYHFEMIANEVARSLMNLSVKYSTPIGFEVLAVNTQAQAEDRASKNNHNKGIEAANAILLALKTMENIK